MPRDDDARRQQDAEQVRQTGDTDRRGAGTMRLPCEGCTPYGRCRGRELVGDSAMSTIAIYARLSTADAGDSLAGQVDLCRRWLETQSLSTDDVQIFQEDAQSAFSKSMTKRPEWSRLEKEVRRGNVTRIVARHMDRITRSVDDLLYLVKLVQATDVKIDTVWSGDLNLNSATGRQIATITAAIAQGESDTKAERIRAAKARTRSKGAASGGVRPFGWESVNGGLREDEAELIRTATNYVLDGGSLSGATRMFRDSGLNPPKAKQWTPTAVRYVLTRWRNAGRLSHEKADAGPSRTFPPIVSLDDLKAVKSILEGGLGKQTASVSAGPYPTTLLSGLATCSRCNDTYKGGGRANQRGLAVYRCRTCNSSIARDLLDELVADAMLRFWSRVDVADVAPTEEIKNQIQSVRADLARVEVERSEAVALVAEGVISASELRTMLAPIAERQTALGEQMRALQEQSAVANALHLDNDLIGTGSTLLSRWHDEPLDLRRKQVAEVWDIAIRPVDEVKARTFVVGGVEYREHVTKQRAAQRRAVFTCRLAPGLSFDPALDDLHEAMESVAAQQDSQG